MRHIIFGYGCIFIGVLLIGFSFLSAVNQLIVFTDDTHKIRLLRSVEEYEVWSGEKGDTGVTVLYIPAGLAHEKKWYDVFCQWSKECLPNNNYSIKCASVVPDCAYGVKKKLQQEGAHFFPLSDHIIMTGAFMQGVFSSHEISFSHLSSSLTQAFHAALEPSLIQKIKNIMGWLWNLPNSLF